MKEIEYDTPTQKRAGNPWEEDDARSRGSRRAPTVRTFRADVEELIQEKGTTRTQIVMAEAARREERGQSRLLHEEDDSHLGRAIFLLVLMFAFVLGIGAYVLIGAKISIPFISDKSVQKETPITTDTINILITDSPREQIVADLSIAFGKTSLPQDEVREVSFTVKDPNGSIRTATTNEMLTALALKTPPKELLRSLGNTPLYGIYSKEKLTGYIQIPSRSYPNTFSGMLLWEPSMWQDLTPVLDPWYNRKNIKNLMDRPFKDEHIGNIDVRVLRDVEGKTVIAYAFVDKKILIMSNSTDTLIALTTKLTQQ